MKKKRNWSNNLTKQSNTCLSAGLVGLEEYIETGIPLDADVTGALLINTFIPNTPLHDGAVIIKNNRIAVAAAYLPLSDSKLIPKELGTRHRAAVGISEETGEISITKDNELLRSMTQKNYLKFLRAQLYKKEESNKNLFTDLLTRLKGVGKWKTIKPAFLTVSGSIGLFL